MSQNHGRSQENCYSGLTLRLRYSSEEEYECFGNKKHWDNAAPNSLPRRERTPHSDWLGS